MAEAFDEGKWFDQSTAATRPGNIAISFNKLEWFRRRLNWGHRYLGVGQIPRERWAVHLDRGLTNAAMVISEKPLVVAVYTSEFDCVAMLRFNGLPNGLSVRKGDRLLSVNTFERRKDEHRTLVERDLISGHNAGRSIWFNVHPAIADFLSDDAAAIAARKDEISPGEWSRVEGLAAEYVAQFPRRWRDGNPYLSHLAAK